MNTWQKDIEARVELAGSYAMTYVWGRQDAGESPRDSGEASRFSTDYAQHVRDYHEERRHSMLSLRNAYELWRATGRIEG